MVVFYKRTTNDYCDEIEKILPLSHYQSALSSFTRDPIPHPFLGSFPTVTRLFLVITPAGCRDSTIP